MLYILVEGEESWTSAAAVLEGPEMDLRQHQEFWLLKAFGPKPTYDGEIPKSYPGMRMEEYPPAVQEFFKKQQQWNKDRRGSFAEFLAYLKSLGFKEIQNQVFDIYPMTNLS